MTLVWAGLRSNHAITYYTRRIRIMICSSCGTEVAEGVSFCPRCGAKIEAASKMGSGLKLAPMAAEPKAPGADTTYGSVPTGNIMHGYNGNPVVAGNIISTTANASYSSIAMDSDEPLMDLDEYYRKDCSPKTKQFVKTGYVILYIVGVLNLLLAFLSFSNSDLLMWKSTTGDGMLYIDPTWSLVGGAVLLIGAIGVHKMKSRAFAGVACAYAVFMFVRNLMMVHRISGWLLLLASGYALYGTWQLHKDYENYKAMKTMIR